MFCKDLYDVYICVCMYVWNIHKSNYNKNIGEIAYIYIYTCTQHKFLTCLVFKKIYKSK